MSISLCLLVWLPIMSERIATDATSPAPLLVVGSVAFDNVITPYGEKEHILGGAASYCSFASSYFAETRMGCDLVIYFAEEFLDRLRARIIDLVVLQRVAVSPTCCMKGTDH